MELRLLQIFIFLFVLHCANAKKYSGGGGSRTFGGSRSRPSTSWGHTTSHNTPSRTSTNYNPSYNPAPRPSYTPSAPSYHPTNTHSSNFGRPSGVVNERHQQSSASATHNNPYERQPAYNPHVNNGFGSHGTSTGTHSAPPYPINQPNHPHPSNLGSSSFPSTGGYHPVNNGGVYHPPSSGSYHPPSSGGYHPPIGAGYHPVSSGGVYHAPTNAAAYHPPSGGYHPPTSGVYHPPTYSQPPSHTVYVLPDSRSSSRGGRPGIGTYIASGVAGGVAAGATNAIVDHAISSIFRPNSHGVHTYPSAPAPGTPTTSITNNYYYNNGAPDAAPSNNGAPLGNQPEQTNSFNGQPSAASSPNSPSTTNYQGPTGNYNGGQSGRHNGVVSRTPEQPVDRRPEQPQEARPDGDNYISDDDLMKLSEELFDNLNTNINQYVELNLQKRVAIIDGPLPDEAGEPLFIVKPGLESLPTVSKLKALYNNYQRNGTQKEIASFDKQNKENAFLDEVMKTPTMKKALNWLSEKHYVKSNDYDQKELLRTIWFTIFGDTSSSFEHVFLSENYGPSGIVGMQNWIYVADQESKHNVDYMGYIDMLSLSGKGALLKVNLKSEDTPLQGLSMFVGTPPELEMALYTVCMHARFNGYCPVSLGGAKLFISTQAFKQNNNYLIDVALPLL
ncbi:endoribonuclease CG2145-like isoform X2 [Phymastichus coffea]|uniref:endoribonuclease CG2145-like isoform X2 n=1 Tax=Phymastichus coffea TaxID=108790 RepID=UPI00273CEEBF|nr:endoribonuclease CG2145-like isoform X2 [Phymastichus coffea]